VSRILLIDDDVRFRRTLHLALDSHGYDVGEAASGKEALDSIPDHSPDLIVLDCHMPRMSGLETCRAIRAKFNQPVIMVSANQSNSRQAALEAGAVDYLAKPFALEDLLQRIEIALNLRAGNLLPRPKSGS
jgi:DNA-binding response OmpR family regulator